MREHIVTSSWRPSRLCRAGGLPGRDARLTCYQRALRQAARMAAARRRIDWNCYTPLTPGESLQARSIVEAEAFENIEAEARRQRHLRLREQLDEPVT